jgi:hypothetical protein
VIGSDLSGCAADALQAFFSAHEAQPCASSDDPFAPTPITPARLGAVHPPAALRGRPGQTLVAVLDTVLDLSRQIVGATIEVNAELPSGSSFGGLRGGYARIAPSAVSLHDLSYVRGLTPTAWRPVPNGAIEVSTIRIGGSRAAPGSVTLGAASRRVSGMLGGRRFDISLATVKLARAGAQPAEWPALARLAPLLRRKP